MAHNNNLLILNQYFSSVLFFLSYFLSHILKFFWSRYSNPYLVSYLVLIWYFHLLIYTINKLIHEDVVVAEARLYHVLYIALLSLKSNNIPFILYNYMQGKFFNSWCYFFFFLKGGHVLSAWMRTKRSIS